MYLEHVVLLGDVEQSVLSAENLVLLVLLLLVIIITRQDIPWGELALRPGKILVPKPRHPIYKASNINC